MLDIKRISLLFFCFCASYIAHATTVKEIAIDELATTAEFIFEGRCIDTTTQQVSNSRFIKTVATFEVIDVIKGNYSELTIQLDYLGGKLNGKELKVGDMQLPEVDDHGIYFVEKLNEQQVHPLLGWDQGRINIREDVNGVERVGTSHDNPITNIQTTTDTPTPSIQSTLRDIQQSQDAGISHGVARGVQAIEQSNWESALSKQDFKNKIKDIINQ